MNKYNIGETVYYSTHTGIRSGVIEGMEKAHFESDKVRYDVTPSHTSTPALYEWMIHPTVDELIEWLKTTVK